MLHFCRLEGGCNFDYIEVFDGPYRSSPLLARVCNGASGSFTSSSNFMSIRFISDVSVTRAGFRANYYSSPSPGSTRKSSALGCFSEPSVQPSRGCEMRNESHLVRSPRLELVQEGVKRKWILGL